uniref:Uncharacterized protein n=1 Tax=Arion vulgaris TaxID=1028688 RepID=A0A0B7AGL4_9EUPU
MIRILCTEKMTNDNVPKETGESLSFMKRTRKKHSTFFEHDMEREKLKLHCERTKRQ